MKLDPPPPAAVPDQIQSIESVPVPEQNTELELNDPLIDWHRGDVPMIRNWHKILGYQAVLAAAMFAGQANADGDGTKNSDKPATVDVKAFKDQLDRIETSTKALETIKKDITSLQD